jgi:hypothetical protein
MKSTIWSKDEEGKDAHRILVVNLFENYDLENKKRLEV